MKERDAKSEDEMNRLKTILEDPQIKIRITPFIKSNIAVAAKKNGRSKAAEILHRLKLSFENGAKLEKS